jgi:RNA polymerase sigma-70 factor (ECF subfamily)
VRDHFRTQAGQPVGAGGTDAQQQLHQVPETPPESSSQRLSPDSALVHRALALIQIEFEETTWRAFWRATIEGHNATEIANDLGMTPRAVRQAKYRVLRRLRQELGGLPGSE